jgi:hypothetical protein
MTRYPDIKAYRIGGPYRVAISFDIRTQKCPDIEVFWISALDCIACGSIYSIMYYAAGTWLKGHLQEKHL